ncbi:MAG: hypothetical protein IH607_06815 [Firmicutes bacterium]|nr:hypothetical protein [Bacillota bacterium]
MRHKPFRRFFCLLLLLAFVCGTAAATDAPQSIDPADTSVTFPNSLTWQASLDDVRMAQSVENINDYVLQAAGDTQEFWFANPDTQQTPAGTYYIFRKDQLACYGIEYGAYEPAAATVIIGDLTEAYGSPLDPATGQAIDMFNAYKPDAFPPDILYAALGWTASDGTAIYYMNITDEMYVFYANADRLFATEGAAE